MDPLGTASCRETVPMELPVPNGSMHHREPKSEIDDIYASFPAGAGLRFLYHSSTARACTATLIEVLNVKQTVF